MGFSGKEASRRCGLRPMPPIKQWYGEPKVAERHRFEDAALLAQVEPERWPVLWRRHGHRAVEIAERIAMDPDSGRVLSSRVDYCPAEVAVMAEYEQICTLEDFLRRRTNLAQVEREEDLLSDSGVISAAGLLFQGH